MKTVYQQLFLLVAVVVTLGVVSCNKGLTSASRTSTGGTVTASATSATITVSATLSSSNSSSGSADSVLILQPCGDGNYRDSIDSASVPTNIITYLDSNYAGFTYAKGFVIKDSSGTIKGYAIVIFYNNVPVGLLFNASGTFVKVLEQRQHGDMDGRGWHEGGRFGDRGNPGRDTLALSSLPTAITTYMASNYPGDTLLKAFLTHDSGYVVISANNGIYATEFTANGTFIKRALLPSAHGKPASIAQTDLPSAVLTYLSTTYPNYVFNKAFSLSKNGTVQQYLVIITANSTKYAVVFDASGNFVAARTIH